MVSLRARKPVKYDSFVGLENLDLSDDGKGNPADDDDSSASEEFAGDEPQTKSKRSKGKGRKTSQHKRYNPDEEDESSDDAFQHEAVSEESDSDDGNEGDETPGPSSKRSRGAAKTTKRKRADRGGYASDEPLYIEEDEDVKPALDELVAAAGKGVRRRAQQGGGDDGYGETIDVGENVRTYKIRFPRLGGGKTEMLASTYPLHSLGVTSLALEPDLGKVSSTQVNYLPSDPDSLRSQRRAIWRKHSETIPLEIPWQFWEGEPWFPECYPSQNAASQSRRMIVKVEPGEEVSWPRSRWEVDVGVGDSGSYKKDEIKILSKEESLAFMPHRPEQDGLTIHLGVGEDSPVVKTSALQGVDSPRNRAAAMFDVGGRISGMDWCPQAEEASSKRGFKQYLAVAVQDHVDDDQPRCGPAGRGGGVQLWALSPTIDPEHPTMSCELVICFETQPLEVRWMPLGAVQKTVTATDRFTRLGIIAVVLEDGTVQVVGVPEPASLSLQTRKRKPESVFIQVPAINILRGEVATATSLDWACATRIAVGFNDGSVAVWDNALRSARPTFYIPTHTSAVKEVQWCRAPMADASGRPRFDLPPPLLCSSGYDGDIRLTDLRDVSNAIAVDKFMRGVPVLAWSGFSDTLWRTETDYWVTAVRLRPSSAFTELRVLSHEGPITALAGSDYHGMVTSGGADGKVKWCNGLRNLIRSAKLRASPQGTVYQYELNRNTGEYRLIDNLLPEAIQLDSKLTGKGKNSSKSLTGGTRLNSAGWPPRAGITKLCWNSAGGIGRAGLLASGTGSGLTRIDMMHGYFYKGREVPRVDEAIDLDASYR